MARRRPVEATGPETSVMLVWLGRRQRARAPNAQAERPRFVGAAMARHVVKSVWPRQPPVEATGPGTSRTLVWLGRRNGTPLEPATASAPGAASAALGLWGPGALGPWGSRTWPYTDAVLRCPTVLQLTCKPRWAARISTVGRDGRPRPGGGWGFIWSRSRRVPRRGASASGVPGRARADQAARSLQARPRQTALSCAAQVQAGRVQGP